MSVDLLIFTYFVVCYVICLSYPIDAFNPTQDILSTYPVLVHDKINDLTLYEQVRGTPYTVGFNGRAITINGANVLLQSGSIHYPRSTPEMWPHLMQAARQGGLNTIQIYVFWNYHEISPGVYDFTSENRNLAQFLQSVGDAGLFANLRIGPFVCAEWTYGGIPLWMRDGHTTFRTNDTHWETRMESFVTYIAKYIEPYLARNGGPIILAQIENEYDNMEGNNAGNIRYVQWCADLTTRLALDIPWVMCSSHDAPSFIINTCNGFYCDNWISGHQNNFPNQPPMWTEDWTGWFYSWGQSKPARPSEDLAFAIARWVARGGAHHNHYMYHGGTTFGRNTGGPQDTTSYDYNAALSEDGTPHPVKYPHTTNLHNIITQYAASIVGNPIAKEQDLSANCQAHLYGNINQAGVLFLSNIDDASDCTVTYANMQWTLPAWSVTIVDTQTMKAVFKTNVLPNTTDVGISGQKGLLKVMPSSITSIEEPIGIWDAGRVIRTPRPVEQFNITRDATDYLWYVAAVTITQSQITRGSITLELNNVNEVMYVYMNSVRHILASGSNINRNTYTIQLSTVGIVSPGTYFLQILVMTMGLANCCGGLEGFTRGLQGNVVVDGQDITAIGWLHLPGLQGEEMQYYSSSNNAWQRSTASQVPFIWYNLTITSPTPISPLPTWRLDLGRMSKGFVWVNGHGLGRYWNITATRPACTTCDYRGAYGDSKCRFDCGEPSLQYYHVPRSWLKSPGQQNQIILFEERGGDPTAVSLIEWK